MLEQNIVIIPFDNLQSSLNEIEGIEIIPVKRLEEVFELALIKNTDHESFSGITEHKA